MPFGVTLFALAALAAPHAPPPVPGTLRVAYVKPDVGELWVARGDGHGRQKVDEVWEEPCIPGCGPGAVSPPAWSPDGRRLAYWRWSSQRGKVLVVNDLRGRLRPYDVHWGDGRVQHLVAVETRPRSVTPPLRGPGSTDLSEPPLWSPDGTKLAFVRQDAEVEIVRAGDGRGWTLETRRLASRWQYAWSELSLAWSPRSDRLAVTATGGTWIARVRGGALRRFAPRRARVRDPSWSPDGTKLAYSRGDARGNGQILVASLDGRRVVKLTNDVPRDRFAHFANSRPFWSPDGSKVAFLSNRDGAKDEEVFVVGADGRGERRLTRGVFAQTPLRWSRDGRRIVFLGGDPRLLVVGASGRGLRRLVSVPPDTGNGGLAPFDFAWVGRPRRPRRRPLPPPARPRLVAAVRDHAPLGTARIVGIRPAGRLSRDYTAHAEVVTDLSPDGGRLALAILDARHQHRFGVAVHDIATGVRRMLAGGAALSPQGAGPLFSYDGRELLFRRWRELVAVDVASGRQRLVARRAGDGLFFWLRDGSVAFVGPERRLLVAGRDGRVRRTDVWIPNSAFWAPSPDGRLVLYLGGCRTWVASVPGGARRAVSGDVEPVAGSWSPRGTGFALVRPAYGLDGCARSPGEQGTDVLVFDRHRRHLATMLGLREEYLEFVTPRWSSDGHWLLVDGAYGGSRPPPSPVYAYSAATGTVTRVLRGPTLAPLTGPDGVVLFSRRSERLGRVIPLELGRITGG